MATQTFDYLTCDKLCCGTLPADVILCLPTGLTASGLSTINATLVAERVSCSNHSCIQKFVYIITVDEDQLAEGVTLSGAEITGIVCRSCLTDYIDNTALGGITGDLNLNGLINATGNITSEQNVVGDAFLLEDGEDKNLNNGISGTGLSVHLTASSVELNSTGRITLTNAGTYLLLAFVNLQYVGATFAANRNVQLKLRRTNNTPDDVSGSDLTIGTGIVTTVSGNFAAVTLPPVTYSTNNTDDIVSIFGSVSVIPTAGNLDAKALSLMAIRLYR